MVDLVAHRRADLAAAAPAPASRPQPYDATASVASNSRLESRSRVAW